MQDQLSFHESDAVMAPCVMCGCKTSRIKAKRMCAKCYDSDLAERKAHAKLEAKHSRAGAQPTATPCADKCKYCGEPCENTSAHGRCNKCRCVFVHSLKSMRFSGAFAAQIARMEAREAPMRVDPDNAAMERLNKLRDLLDAEIEAIKHRRS